MERRTEINDRLNKSILPRCRGFISAKKLAALSWITIGGFSLAAPTPGHRLVWQDEFDGSSLDPVKWQYRTDTRFWSTQLPQNVSVADGMLKLHLRKETVNGVNYTAGGVISRALFRYGYYEARMKVPPGSGWHTSFWMMKYNRPATDTVAIELDVIENDSVTPLKYGVNVHRHLPTPHITFGNKFITTPSLSADYHIFGCEFTPTTIRYYFDGTLVQTVDATQLPHNDMNIWLTSIAAPLGGTTAVDDSQLPALALFDYVRFYEPFPAPTLHIASPTKPAVTLADPAATLRLVAAATSPDGAPVIQWSLIEGPSPVVFSNPQSASTDVSFSTPGSYLLQCAASNEGGSTTDRVHIGVAAPTTMVLREDPGDSYQHTATIIRGDYPQWNAGARSQLLVGRNTQPFRSVFSFDLSPLGEDAVIHQVALDLRTESGQGSIGNLRLRALSATPTEGTGTADGSAGADIGTGTGTTWITRTGGTEPPALWTAPGGDFTNAILTEIPGFDAALPGIAVTLPSTPAFTAAAGQAYTNGTPLDLILSAASEGNTSAFARLASDDALLTSNRPALRLVFTGMKLPAIDPGSPPAARAGQTVSLNGSTSDDSDTIWEQVSGPAPVVFNDASLPTTGIIFPGSGNYQLRFAATNILGTVERQLLVNVSEADPAFFEDWQRIQLVRFE
jgi:hypothetical protein